MTRHELMDEVRRLRRRADAWDDWYAAHEAHVQEHGGPCYLGDKPDSENEGCPDEGAKDSEASVLTP